MGRRKIEIIPITHERNRSVTFLKRKNGLFKKAYELGVLCSVDVAVIIFEQRPGHNVKLYQYCSGDVHDVVQRHVRFEGEKDTRGPVDFSGNAAAKLEDPADGDDDDQDDDDDQGIRLGTKRRSDGSKAGSDLALNIDIDYRRSGQHQRPQSSSLPLSNDRHSPSSKKPRIAQMPTGRAPAEMSPGTYSYASPLRSISVSSPTYPSTAPYYPPMSAQAQSAAYGSSSSFDSYQRSTSQRSIAPGYGEYGGIGSSSSSRPTPHRGGEHPFALVDQDERQITGSFGGIEWPVHSGSHGNSTGVGGMRRVSLPSMFDRNTNREPATSATESSGSTSEWLGMMGGGRGGTRIRDSEKTGSRNRGGDEYEIKKET